MCNAEKTVIYIPKLSIGQYLILFDIIYYLKCPDLQQILDIKKNFALAKRLNSKNLKIRLQQRRVKSKCSIDKKIKILPILYQFHHKSLYVDMYFYLSAIISRKKFAIVNLFLISRRNHSSLINNIVTKKIKYFPQLLAFMPQIEDGDGTNMKILSCFDESLPPN